MADLISRAAAMGAFMGKPPEYYHTSYIVGELNCVPAVDAVPVVRCMHCKYWWEVNELCTHPRHVDGMVCIHECNATDYCSDGKRRDGA